VLNTIKQTNKQLPSLVPTGLVVSQKRFKSKSLQMTT